MPGENIDPRLLRALAALAVVTAAAVGQDVAQTVREWRTAQEHYVAPESPALVSGLDPLIVQGRALGDRVEGLRPIVVNYANEAERILGEIRRLESSPGSDPEAQAAQARELDRLRADLEALERQTAAAIRGLLAEARVPEKVRVNEVFDKGAFSIAFGPITLGQDAGLRVTTFSDGTMQATVVNGQNTTVSGGVGPLIDLGGGLTVQIGNSWRFQDINEYNAFRGQLTEAATRQIWSMDPGGAYGVALAEELRPLRPPDLTVSEVAVPVSGSVALDAGALAVNESAEATFKQTVTVDHTTGTTTTATTRDYSGTTGGELTRGGGVAGITDGSVLSSGTQAVRGPDGQLNRVVLTVTERDDASSAVGAAGGTGEQPDPGNGKDGKDGDLVTGGITDTTTRAGVRTTTTSVPLDTPEERALGEQFLARETYDPEGALDDRDTYLPERAVPGDPFQNLVHEDSTTVEQDLQEVTRARSGEVGVDLGPAAGLEVGLESTEIEATDSRYREPAGDDGVRRSAPLFDE